MLRVAKTLGVFAEPEAMHLRDYSSFFQPEEFDALTAAYDAAWQQLWAKSPSLPSRFLSCKSF